LPVLLWTSRQRDSVSPTFLDEDLYAGPGFGASHRVRRRWRSLPRLVLLIHPRELLGREHLARHPEHCGFFGRFDVRDDRVAASSHFARGIRFAAIFASSSARPFSARSVMASIFLNSSRSPLFSGFRVF